MSSQPFWINPQLAIIPRPQGGLRLDHALNALRKARIDAVVSVLTPPEVTEMELERESEAAERAGLEFINFPIQNGNVPGDIERFLQFLTRLEARMAHGKRIGIHCRGCVGRSSVVAASLLIRSGVAPAQAWREIECARGCPVPGSNEQREWVESNIGPLA